MEDRTPGSELLGPGVWRGVSSQVSVPTRVCKTGAAGSGPHIQQSPYQHPPFDEEARDYLRQIKAALDEVYPQSLEQWEDGFRRDRDAEREIAIWLHIAEVYDRLTAEKDLAARERQDVFRLLLACANNPRERVLTTAGVQTLSRPESEAVVAEFYGPQKDAN